MVAVRKINSYSLQWTPETEYAFLIDYLMRKEEQISIKQNQVSGMTIGMINSADVFDFKSMHTHLRGVRQRIKALQNKHGFTPSTYLQYKHIVDEYRDAAIKRAQHGKALQEETYAG